ncbi:MAG: gliding motility-associated C-terminal domain-containing protein [Chitinophagaceae bacterium]|uniref:gliding motility-associated C-terminal domain-containing protein n=1 Tax=unclassified Paraflavitalea TaxID=2798305 RepID=UPI003D326AD4|nr:gliding motility-associated C-terminal domain-containing protein [Chitinophagaceae bacterium]
MRIFRLLSMILALSGAPFLGFGAVFTVTNTNNAGPGSLRDAIEQANANGTLTTDFINFNLPSNRGPAQITVPFAQPLPIVSSNIVIDGTSNPGAALGVTGAKVIIAFEGLYGGGGTLTLLDLSGASNVSIFGIYFKAAVLDRVTNLPYSPIQGLYISQSSNIVIGEAFKGNVFTGFTRAVFSEINARFSYSQNVKVQANFFGIDTDGKSIQSTGRVAVPTANGLGVILDQTQGVVVGGPNREDKNYFNSNITDIQVSGEFVSGIDGGVTIDNNYFGVDYFDQYLDIATGTAINISKVNSWRRGFPPVKITNNYIGGRQRAFGIVLNSLLTKFFIQNNQIGFDDNGVAPRNSNYGTAILLYDCKTGLIGDPTDLKLGNSIRHWNEGAITSNSCGDIAIQHNSTFCNSKRAIKILNWNVLNNGLKQPFVTINQLNVLFGIVSGTSLPNATIELFYDDECPGCEGKTYFATVQANALGQWRYNGPLARENVIATATSTGISTSEYSMPEVNGAGVVINPIRCLGDLGSICGLNIISGTRWRWEDQSGAIVGTDTCLKNVGPGDYYLKLSIGNETCEESFKFTIADQTLSIDSTTNGVRLTHTRCAKPTGRITGMVPKNATQIIWENTAGQVVGSGSDLNNVAAGSYRMRISNGFCEVRSDYYTLYDVSPKLDTSKIVINPASCDLNNGSIRNITATGMDFSQINWLDANRVIVANSFNLNNRAPGSYKLIVYDPQLGCADSTFTYTITSIPSPLLITTNATIKNSTCSNSNGSITGVTTQNTIAPVYYRWVDANNQTVGNTLDLVNVKAGRYFLKMKDAGNCDTVVSLAFNIADQGSIQLDTSAVKVNPTGCTVINGSITGIQITGADSYVWKDQAGVVVGNALELANKAIGTYTLTASNSFGCSIQTNAYSIKQSLPIPVAVAQHDFKNASCGNNNGSIDVTQLSASNNLFKFSWLRDSLTNIGSTLSIANLSPANYFLIATDTNGCVQSIFKKTIVNAPMAIVDESKIKIVDDTCSLGKGAITGLAASIDQGSLSFNWFQGTNAVGSTTNISNLSPGVYFAVITDNNGCKYQTSNYTVLAATRTIAAPVYTTITVARNSKATISVVNFQQNAVYELLDANNNVLQKNNTGIFTINSVPENITYKVRVTVGTCDPGNGSATIKVEDITALTIPNAFSPNGDGINDKFVITLVGYFRHQGLKIFNRYGQLVFESRDITLSWDGNIGGKPAPIGTYYWVIEGYDVRNQFLRKSGAVTLIR